MEREWLEKRGTPHAQQVINCKTPQPFGGNTQNIKSLNPACPASRSWKTPEKTHSHPTTCGRWGCVSQQKPKSTTQQQASSCCCRGGSHPQQQPTRRRAGKPVARRERGGRRQDLTSRAVASPVAGTLKKKIGHRRRNPVTAAAYSVSRADVARARPRSDVGRRSGRIAP
jgi:hypothetical protein